MQQPCNKSMLVESFRVLPGDVTITHITSLDGYTHGCMYTFMQACKHRGWGKYISLHQTVLKEPLRKVFYHPLSSVEDRILRSHTVYQLVSNIWTWICFDAQGQLKWLIIRRVYTYRQLPLTIRVNHHSCCALCEVNSRASCFFLVCMVAVNVFFLIFFSVYTHSIA